MSAQITIQANKLWQMVSAPSTAETYRQSLVITWTILKETAFLIWLVLCLILVFFDWLGSFAVMTGRQLRAWFDGLKETNTDQLASDTGKALLTVGKTGIASALTLAREQLGLPEKPSAPEPPLIPTKPSVVVPTPSPVAPPAPAKPAPPEPTPEVTAEAVDEE